MHSSFEKFLNPQILKQNLIAASVYITAYELLKDGLISHVRGLLSHTSSYKEKVRVLAEHELEACARWFQQMGAITEDDVALIVKITDHRNLLAHELPAVISSSEKSISFSYLRDISTLMTKIDNWWTREIVSDNSETQNGETYSLRSWFISALIQVAEGNDTAIAEVYAEWNKLVSRKPSC